MSPPVDEPAWHAATADRIVNAALVVLGALAVVDSVVFRWLLAFHRFKQGWSGSVYVEVLLVAVGAADGDRRVCGSAVPASDRNASDGR